MNAPRRTVLLHYLLGAWAMLTVVSWTAAGSAITIGAALQQELDFRDSRAAEDGKSGEDLRYAALVQGDANHAWITVLKRLQVNLAGVVVLVAAWPPRRPKLVCLPLVLAAGLSAVLAWLVAPSLLDMVRAHPFADIRGPGRVDADALNSLLSVTLLLEVAKVVCLGVAIRFSSRSAEEAAPSA